MQVNVFITRQDGALRTQLLVLPVSPEAAIPPHLRSGSWTFYATLDSTDAMLEACGVQAAIEARGYCVMDSRRAAVAKRHPA